MNTVIFFMVKLSAHQIFKSFKIVVLCVLTLPLLTSGVVLAFDDGPAVNHATQYRFQNAPSDKPDGGDVHWFWAKGLNEVVHESEASFKKASSACFTMMIGERYLESIVQASNYEELKNIWYDYKTKKILGIYDDHHIKTVNGSAYVGYKTTETKIKPRAAINLFNLEEHHVSFEKIKKAIDRVDSCVYLRFGYSPVRIEYTFNRSISHKVTEQIKKERFNVMLDKNRMDVLERISDSSGEYCQSKIIKETLDAPAPKDPFAILSNYNGKIIQSKNMMASDDQVYNLWRKEVDKSIQLYLPNQDKAAIPQGLVTVLDAEGYVKGIHVLEKITLNDSTAENTIRAICAASPYLKAVKAGFSDKDSLIILNL